MIEDGYYWTKGPNSQHRHYRGDFVFTKLPVFIHNESVGEAIRLIEEAKEGFPEARMYLGFWDESPTLFLVGWRPMTQLEKDEREEYKKA